MNFKFKKDKQIYNFTEFDEETISKTLDEFDKDETFYPNYSKVPYLSIFDISSDKYFEYIDYDENLRIQRKKRIVKKKKTTNIIIIE